MPLGLTIGYIVTVMLLIFMLTAISGALGGVTIYWIIPIGLIVIFGTSVDYLTALISGNIAGISLAFLFFYWWFK